MILPPPDSFITRAAACSRKNSAFTFTANTLSHSLSVTSSRASTEDTAALLTKMSRLPKCLIVLLYDCLGRSGLRDVGYDACAFDTLIAELCNAVVQRRLIQINHGHFGSSSSKREGGCLAKPLCGSRHENSLPLE